MKIEDLHYDLSSAVTDDGNWNIETWRKDFPMDYLKAIYILNMATNGIVQSEVFKAIYRITRLHIPNTLYKYYSLSNDDALNRKKFETLSKQQIYMSAIEDFNDPFDSKCFFYDPHQLSDITRLKRHGGKLIDDFSSYIRGTALTENGFQSLPMWAHYSNNHAGFCVAYNMEENIPLKGCTFPVQYVEERLDITSFMKKWATQLCEKIDHNVSTGIKQTLIDDLSIVYMPLLLCNLKLSQWSYEKEYRCTTASNAKGMPYIEAKPKAIYIGAKCSVQHSKELIKIAQSLKIPVYKMSVDETNPSCELISSLIQ